MVLQCRRGVSAGENSGIAKRYFHHTEERIHAHLELLDRALPSLRTRLDLAFAAAKKAITEWGRPAADITHLVIITNSRAHSPGVDTLLTALLGLRMLHLHSCSGGCVALRVAKNLAENNLGVRVLVVCVEAALLLAFQAPDDLDAHVANSRWPHSATVQARRSSAPGRRATASAPCSTWCRPRRPRCREQRTRSD
ncbi:hypothetical protein QOZ80_9AG0686680 [Eleusine coracana subsp. coracana]|nr:hypothetical protein QOZ80_9AG0686680 [Eleusine coracana subsp. coracana]